MVNRREGYLASVHMELVIFTLFFCSSAECSSPAATAPRHYVRRSGSGAVGNGLDTTIKYLRRTRNGAAGAGLGTTIVTATNNCFGQLSDHHDHVSAWLRGHLPGYHDYVPCLVFVRGAPASELRS
jgi:hypothetical protein